MLGVQTADSGMSEVEVCTVKGKCIQFWKEELCTPAQLDHCATDHCGEAPPPRGCGGGGGG